MHKKERHKLLRFGVSIEEDLLKQFDALIRGKGYSCRSEALRDLIRQELIQKQWQQGKEVAGAISLIYNHHRRQLVNRLMDIEHDYGDLIISSQHIHLDHDNCLEIIAVKGVSQKVAMLADRLKATKGVKHVTLSMSTTGKDVV